MDDLRRHFCQFRVAQVSVAAAEIHDFVLQAADAAAAADAPVGDSDPGRVTVCFERKVVIGEGESRTGCRDGYVAALLGAFLLGIATRCYAKCQG